MALLLSLRRAAGPGPLAIDLGGVLPDGVRGLTLAEIARLEVRADEVPCLLGDVLDLAGDPGDARFDCRGDFSRVHALGAGMGAGEILVRGPAGRHAGAGMRGGTLRIAGNAGDWLAAEMAGGSVHVEGCAGDNVAAAYPGSGQGVRGGTVIVNEGVGSLAGARMRRGILAIGGDCGPGAALELRAGTVVVGGRLGPHAGCGMRRGSLVALGDPPTPPATFSRGVAWQPGFLPVLLASLARSGFRPALAGAAGTWRQWHGDHLAGGRGELLCRDATEPGGPLVFQGSV